MSVHHYHIGDPALDCHLCAGVHIERSKTMSAPQGSKAGAEGDVKLSASSVPPTTYGKFQVGFNQEFELDRKCSVKLPDLFVRNAQDGLLRFKVEDDILDLESCLCAVRKEDDKFLPPRIFVRKHLNRALLLRQTEDHRPTVVFGSPGVGKSVFCFLAAIASAFLERNKTVLYVRKVEADEEPSISLFWITEVGEEKVEIVASRNINEAFSIRNVCRAINLAIFKGQVNLANSPTENGVKIIVDGPQYADKLHPRGSDLVTSGGCPPQKQQNMAQWQFPIDVWSFDQTYKALKSLYKCTRATVEKIFDTTGGSIRLATKCSTNSGKVDEKTLSDTQKWMERVVEAQGNSFVVDMAFHRTKLSSDEYSMNRLRSMIVKEDQEKTGHVIFFDTTLVLASAFIARLLWSKLEISQVLKAMNFARSTQNQSLYDWHFELWCHKLSELAIEQWQKQAAATATSQQAAVAAGASTASQPVTGASVQGACGAAALPTTPSPAFVQAIGSGKEGIKSLNAVWLYWKPSIPNFANIDSAILLGDGTLCCNQYTVDDTHAFDVLTFLHGFFYNIPVNVLNQVRKIKVVFVVPNGVVFSAVRIPLTQKTLCQSYIQQSGAMAPSGAMVPTIKYVKPKSAKAPSVPLQISLAEAQTGIESMDTDSSYLTKDDDTSSFDDSFDDETWFSETVDMTDTNQPTILVEFEVLSVPTDASPDNFPLFTLPPVPRG